MDQYNQIVRWLKTQHETYNDLNEFRLLVIDDQPYNIASAAMTLKDFNFTAVDNVAGAYDLLDGDASFDIVLTDLWLPRGEFVGAMGITVPDSKQPIPAGLVFAIKAANRGMKAVICTDSDHHQDILCSLLDLIKEETDGESRVSFVEASTCPVEGVWEEDKIVLCEDWYKRPGPYPKNWFKAMERAGLLSSK